MDLDRFRTRLDAAFQEPILDVDEGRVFTSSELLYLDELLLEQLTTRDDRMIFLRHGFDAVANRVTNLLPVLRLTWRDAKGATATGGFWSVDAALEGKWFLCTHAPSTAPLVLAAYSGRRDGPMLAAAVWALLAFGKQLFAWEAFDQLPAFTLNLCPQALRKTGVLHCYWEFAQRTLRETDLGLVEAYLDASYEEKLAGAISA
jgi:hypothetical protein